MPWAAKKKYIYLRRSVKVRKNEQQIWNTQQKDKSYVFSMQLHEPNIVRKKEVNNEKRDWYEGEERFQIKNKFHVLSYLAGSIAEL